MRHFGKLLWLSPLALLGAIAGGVAAFRGDDPKPTVPTPIKLPGQATRGVISGDHYYTIADGQLVGVDLKKGQPTVYSACYQLYPKLAPFLDVADGKACIASEGEIHVIDLAGGDILHSAKYKGEVHGLGFAGDSRVFILGRADVVVLDVASGETVQTIPLMKDEPKSVSPLSGSVYQKVGKLLYVAGSRAERLKIVDLETGKVVDAMGNGFEWFTGLQASGDKAFLRSINLSYGINNPQFGWFDLKTKKYTDLKHPDAKYSDRVEDKDFDRMTLVAGPDAGVCLAWKGMVYQFDGEGRQVGATPLDKDDDGRLVGVWNGQALTVGKDSVRLTPLAKATAAKSD